MIPASRLCALGLFAAAGAAAMASCATTTTTTTYTPITGIEIRSSTLVAGFGCGTGAGQVYRYAAAVSFKDGSEGAEASAPHPESGAPRVDAGAHDAGAPNAEAGVPEAGALDAGAPDAGVLEAGAPRPLTPVEQSGAALTNVFDCFADGVFENLPTSDAGSLTFAVAIFAYDKASYDAAGLPADTGCPPTQESGACTPTSQPLTPAQQALAPWTTVCTATEQAGTPVIAVCGRLVGPAAPFESPDADGPFEAGADAAPAAPDAATDAPPDAAATPPDASFDGGASRPDAGDASTDG